MNKHKSKELPVKPDLSKRYLKKADVAELLGLCHRSIDNLVAAGKLPVCRLSRRIVLFPREAVEKRLAELTS